jgi:hypothetical protein
MAKIRNAYGILARKSEGKNSVERYWHRWDDNIFKLDLKITGWTGFMCLRTGTSDSLL